MSVRDVIKKSFLNSDMYSQTISGSTILTIVVDMLFALILGIVIYEVYKHFYQGVVYSRNYAFSLIAMTVLTCMVTLAISTNVVISLGMVGALSIVRYRTAIKEPLDLVYMFWAITSGITAGASMYILAGISFAVMFLLIFFFGKKKCGRQTYMAVVHYTKKETGDRIIQSLSKVQHTVRSTTMREGEMEMVLQVSVRDGNLSFADKIHEMDDVRDISVMEFDGEYHG